MQTQVRNPWGEIEWNGDWSDQSEKWTPEVIKVLKHEDKNDGRFWMPYKDWLRIFTTIDRCRVFDSSWSVASSWIPYNVEPRSSGQFHFELTQASETVVVLSQPDTRYYGSFNADFLYTLSFHVYEDKTKKLIKRAKITVPYSKRSVNCELKLQAGSYTVIPHVQREPTDILPDNVSGDDEDNAISPSTRPSDVQVVVEAVKMDKSSFMFQQRKASLIRSMSMARVTGRKLLGVDDEDYETEDLPKDLDEEKWQIMLGLRVYSHDQKVSLVGEAGAHPALTTVEPEEVTATLVDKKELVAEPEEESKKETEKETKDAEEEVEEKESEDTKKEE